MSTTTDIRNGGRHRHNARRLRMLGLVGLVSLAAAGCSPREALRLGWPEPITTQGRDMLDLFIGAWLTAILIGIFVWGLIIYSIIKFRKRGEELPRQVRYNLPIEILYTVIPFVIVGVLFSYTAQIESTVDKLSPNPDVTVGVVGFRWNWQFNYVNNPTDPNDNITITGLPAQPAVLVLPVGQSIRFLETSPDVIHSFWVPAFLFKRDVIPGRQNTFEITITEPGTFVGRCAELCGVDHDRMNFEVRAVSQQDYQRFVASGGTFIPGRGLYDGEVPVTAGAGK